MLRVVLTLSFFLLFKLFACEGGYDSCIAKLKDSNSLQHSVLKIPVPHNKRLVFSPFKPHGTILKHDPFLSLYLVDDPKGFAYPFTINMRAPLGVSVVTNTYAKEGKILKHQVGLNHLARFSTQTKAPALLVNSCCSLEGIVTPRGIIEKLYVQRFLNTKDVRYADIGIRVRDAKCGIKVESYDPFMKNNPFKKGDCILSMDGKKVKYSATLMRRILFAKIGSKHSLEIKRDGQVIKINVVSQKRLSGGFKVETYLEKYGITFDKNLYIIQLDQKKNTYGLKIGDKLFKVNAQTVHNQKDVMQHISEYTFHPILLMQRNENFQFFVNLI
ncbi:PDZ domain-containing protein [Sulfurimonas sp. SAG-AH-194-I05]|nr:PDZ domain-containing protein [Sulfurimonas sp. SAG-AH-194-I05]MDF1875990.1 PDZ domain-containing protein [Sulfurimonas sp. SAG-AH-194-I05]